MIRLVTATLLAAAGGILYEVYLGAFGSYLFGDSVKVFSLTTGVYMFFMGVGAFCVRPGLSDPLERLIRVELTLVVLHLLLPFGLWGLFTALWGTNLVFWAGLALSGALVGTEIPLFLAVIRKTEGSSDRRVHQILAADYVGALAASLLFGFWLLPKVGMIGTAAAAALLEGMAVLFLCRRGVLGALGVGAAALSLSILVASPRLQGYLEDRWARQFTSARVIRSEWTGYNQLSLAEFRDDKCACRQQALFLNRHFQWMTGSYLDEYHEMLVVPPVESFRRAAGREPERVAIAGGGDGFAAERFRSLYGISDITVIEIDPRVPELAMREDRWRESGGYVFGEGVRLVVGDAYAELMRWRDRPLDILAFDLPVPTSPGLARFFTRSFFARLNQVLTPHGHLVIQATSKGSRVFGRERFICHLQKALAGGGWRSEVIVGDQLDFYVVAAREPLRWPADGEKLPGRHLREGGDLSRLLTDPWDRFGGNCPATPDNSILRPVILEL